MAVDVEIALRSPDAYNLSRKAIEDMERCKIWPTPLNYELWLHFVGAPDGALAKEISRLLALGETITEDVSEELAALYLPKARLNEQIRDAGDQLNKELASVAQAIKQAQKSSELYGVSLAGAGRDLEQQTEPAAIKKLVETLSAATKKVQKENKSLEKRLAESTAEVVFDTSRGWCQWMPAIARLFPDAKVIACVRDLPWVVDSIERLIQRNVFSPSSIFNFNAGGTVYTRAKSVVSTDGMVGGPYDALKQACYGAQRDRLLLVQYETLSTDPAKTMHAIYSFLGEPMFEHDFGHVDYDVTEFDERAGTPGLHTVRGVVKAEARDTLLPPDLFNRFVNDAFWRDPKRVPAGLQVV